LKNLAPAAEGGQRLNLDRQKSQFSKEPHKPKGFSRIRTLIDIALRWVEHGYYSTQALALEALLGDRL
jgi:hypothetical protein